VIPAQMILRTRRMRRPKTLWHATTLLVPTPEALDAARDTAKALLAIVGVTRVVCVDDNFEGELADLVEVCSRLPDDTPPVSGMDGISFDGPPEIWRQALTNAWDDLSGTERRIALADARDKAGDLESDDHLNAGALGSFFDSTIDFVPMTPEDWQSQSAEILGTAGTTLTLVLFDFELGDGEDGLKLITDLYDKDTAGVVWAGLFTHTVSIAEEGDKWDEFAKAPGIVRERFILLSKSHMGPEPSSFPQALKIALMSTPSAVLRECVSQSIQEQVVNALSNLSDMSPSEFERIVFGLSLAEGMLEIDMLMRLFDAFLRTGVRASVHATEDVRKTISILRRLSEVPTQEISATIQAQRIFRMEVYEEAAYLNEIHAPLELGDVFSTAPGKWMVLVGQPCDLMVRSDGKRAPEVNSVTLLKVVTDDPNARSTDEPFSLSRARPAFELPAFNVETGLPAWALLDRSLSVPIETLEYCVFTSDGISTAPQSGSAPEWMNPSWEKRHKILVKDVKKLHEDIVSSSGKNQKRLKVKEFFGKRHLEGISFDIKEDEIHFRLRRIARLRGQYSRALLTRYAVHLSRDAFEPSII
jgi:hypothetical protein